MDFQYLFSKGGLIIVPLLGNRTSLIVGCLMRTLAPLTTYFFLDTWVSILSLTYGLLNGISNNIILLGKGRFKKEKVWKIIFFLKASLKLFVFIGNLINLEIRLHLSSNCVVTQSVNKIV